MGREATIIDSESGEILIEVHANSMDSLFRKLQWERNVLEVSDDKFREYNTNDRDCDCPDFRFRTSGPCKHIEAYNRRTDR